MTCIQYNYSQYVCKTDKTFMETIHTYMTCKQHKHDMNATHTHMTYIQNTQHIQNMQTKHICVFACMFCIHVCTDMPKKTYMQTNILQTNILQTNRQLLTPFAFVQDLVRQINTQGSRSKHTHTLSHTHTHLPTPFKIVLEQDRYINTQQCVYVCVCVYASTRIHTRTHTQ